MTDKSVVTIEEHSAPRRPTNLKLDVNINNRTDAYSELSTAPCIGKSMNLVFDGISYSVRAGIFTRGRHKLLLNNLSGDFRAGELTAIMGLSGAGKSTLMDVLAGFTLSPITGNVMVNSKIRDLATFRRSSAYIMQNDNLEPLLTVQEAMHVAADLKLNLTAHERLQRIDQVLTALGLYDCRRTRIGHLSGGQRKRVAIALELINNPPIMFFDEPTSGLDNVTSKQCLGLLRALAREGRTVICTIHQPSATMLFDMIDHLYVITEGNCVYTGGTRNLVPFLSSLGLQCPTYHNPADFLMEVCNGDYGDNLSNLMSSIENGKSNSWRAPALGGLSKIEEMIAGELVTPIRAPRFPPSPIAPFDGEEEDRGSSNYATGFWRQLSILLRRNAIRLSRDKVLTFTRLITHVLIGLLVGMLFFQIGQDAAYVFDNFNLLFFSIMFLMFSAFNGMLITFPSELPIVVREHFNRWYKLHSFYLANKLADFPVQIVAASTFILIVYHMSGQIPEGKRFGLFTLMCILVSLVAQTIGLILGIGLDVRNGVIFGPFTILPFLIFSGFFVHLNDAHPYLHWLFHTSFLKYGFEGVMVAIYGYDRPKMQCTDDYCHFALPRTFLETVDMKNVSYWFNISILIGLYLLLDMTAYLVLRIRLKQRW